MFQKVHTFQASLESVLTQLCEAEVAQKSLTNCDTDPNTFRNQLKVTICPVIRIIFILSTIKLVYFHYSNLCSELQRLAVPAAEAGGGHQ